MKEARPCIGRDQIRIGRRRTVTAGIGPITALLARTPQAHLTRHDRPHHPPERSPRRLLGLDPLDSGHGIEIPVEGAEPIKLVLEHHGGVHPVPCHQVGVGIQEDPRVVQHLGGHR